MNLKKTMVLAAAFGALMSAGSAYAASSWDFKNARPNSDWVKDPTKAGYKANRDKFKVSFNKNRVTYKKNEGITFTSQAAPANKPAMNKPVVGGGMANRTGFSNNFFQARCGMIGTGDKSMRRTQASFYLNKVNGNVDSFEADVFEMAAGGNNAQTKLNWINWNKNGNGNTKNDAGGGTWGGNSMANWQLAYNGSNRKFTARRGGASKTHTLNKARTLGDVIILHNKAWRFKVNNQGAGPVANMRCESATKNS